MNLVALAPALAAALLPTPLEVRAIAQSTRSSLVRTFVTGACASSLLMAGSPAAWAAPTLDEAIVQVSEASYPVIRALDKSTFVPFTEKIGNILLTLPPAKLGTSIESAIDVFDSVPADKVDAFNSVLKASFADEKPESCTLVPLPSEKIAKQIVAVAEANVPAEKLKTFSDKWGPAIKTLPVADGAVCLPPVASLDKLSLAQAEVGRSFGAAEGANFAKTTSPMLKSKFTLGTVLPLLDDAKRLTAGASPKELSAFQAAGKVVEGAAKREATQQAMAQVQARKAAAQAAQALQADPAAVAAAREAAAKAKQQDAADREAALAAAKAKAQAAADAKLAEKAKLKEQEAARFADLKAKSAAIAEAKAAAKAAN